MWKENWIFHTLPLDSVSQGFNPIFSILYDVLMFLMCLKGKKNKSYFIFSLSRQTVIFFRSLFLSVACDRSWNTSTICSPRVRSESSLARLFFLKIFFYSKWCSLKILLCVPELRIRTQPPLPMSPAIIFYCRKTRILP